MALDKLVDSSQLDGALSSTADAIRAKTGESGSLTWNMTTGFSVQISNIPTQVNTGTLSISTLNDAGTDTSCDGYANVNITGINIPIPSSGTNTFSIKVPNGNGTIIFIFNVDSSGNVTITES